jgi:hypothetical protein
MRQKSHDLASFPTFFASQSRIEMSKPVFEPGSNLIRIHPAQSDTRFDYRGPSTVEESLMRRKNKSGVFNATGGTKIAVAVERIMRCEQVGHWRRGKFIGAAKPIGRF